MYFILQFSQLEGEHLSKTGSRLIINVKLLATDRIKIGLIGASYLENTFYSGEDTLLSNLYTARRNLLKYASANICQEKKGEKNNFVAFASLGLPTSTGPFFCCIKGNGTNKMRQEQNVWAGLFEIYIPKLRFLACLYSHKHACSFNLCWKKKTHPIICRTTTPEKQCKPKLR